MPRPGTGLGAALDFWFVHEVIVERYTGSDDGYGGGTAAGETLRGLVDQGEHLVPSSSGDLEPVTAKVYLPIETADIPIGTRVTLPPEFGSLTCEVIAVYRRDMGTLPLPEFLEIDLR